MSYHWFQSTVFNVTKSLNNVQICFHFSSCSGKRKQGPAGSLQFTSHKGQFLRFSGFTSDVVIKMQCTQIKCRLMCFRITRQRVNLGQQRMISLTLAELWKGPPTVRQLVFQQFIKTSSIHSPKITQFRSLHLRRRTPDAFI